MRKKLTTAIQLTANHIWGQIDCCILRVIFNHGNLSCARDFMRYCLSPFVLMSFLNDYGYILLLSLSKDS